MQSSRDYTHDQDDWFPLTAEHERIANICRALRAEHARQRARGRTTTVVQGR